MKILGKCDVWLADGTFYSSPKGYRQMFIIHGYYFQKSLPLIYILMKEKTISIYSAIFSKLKSIIENQPKQIITDFISYF